MKRVLLAISLLSIALPVFAVDQNDCDTPLIHLGALYQLRSLMMHRYTTSSDVERFIDRKVDELREPPAGGG